MGAPLVSVVLPTHNRVGLVTRAIASVQAQTCRDWELIVINDASTDNTREVLDRIDDPRIRVIHRERGQGVSAARNAGIKAGQGRYVAFLDDDDYWLPEKLEKQVAALEQSGKPWCIASFKRIKRTGQILYVGGERFTRELDFSSGIGDEGNDWSLISTPGWLVRRDVLMQVGSFDERIHCWEDWELGLRLLQAGGHVILDEPLWVQDRYDGGGLIRNWNGRSRDLRIIMDKHSAFWRNRPKVMARHWYLIGRLETIYEPPPSGRKELLRSLRLNPASLRAWAALGSSLLGQKWNRRIREWAKQARTAARNPAAWRS